MFKSQHPSIQIQFPSSLYHSMLFLVPNLPPSEKAVVLPKMHLLWSIAEKALVL